MCINSWEMQSPNKVNNMKNKVIILAIKCKQWLEVKWGLICLKFILHRVISLHSKELKGVQSCGHGDTGLWWTHGRIELQSDCGPIYLTFLLLPVHCACTLLISNSVKISADYIHAYLYFAWSSKSKCLGWFLCDQDYFPQALDFIANMYVLPFTVGSGTTFWWST